MDKKWPTSPDELRSLYELVVTRNGKHRAISEISRMYDIPNRTVRERLARANVYVVGEKPVRPPADELRAAYEAAVTESGPRGAIGVMASKYQVDYVSVRGWLIELGLRTVKPRAGAPRPITEPCPCGAVATTRYQDEDPALCSRCYMRRYASDPDSAFRRAGRETVQAFKKDKPCTDCGGVFPSCVMDFDHVPERGAKLFHIGRSDHSVKLITEELAKCDIVCANCHRIRTWNRNHGEASEPAS